MDGFTEILSGCRTLLKPGGFLVITARPFRRQGQLVDIPTMATQGRAGRRVHPARALRRTAGGGYRRRADGPGVVLPAGQLRNAFAAGSPTHVTAHEEIIVVRTVHAAEAGEGHRLRLRPAGPR